MIKSDVAIIGGGLTGLALQYLLRKKEIPSVIVEARNRLGGRIYSPKKEGAAPIEMGATWLAPQHRSLIALLKDLGLGVFEQKLGKAAIYEQSQNSPPQLFSLPANGEPSYRIKGGSSELIEALADSVPADHLYCGQTVKSIKEAQKGLIVESDSDIFQANIVVSTLPPLLLKRTIDIEPNLPNAVLETMENTHTWMGDSIKVGLRYKQPFWRTEGTSGTIFSNVGPISEFYDHSNYSDDLYALKGFFNSTFQSIGKEDRLNMVLKQLRKYYGKVVDDYIGYEELVWRNEKQTYVEYENFVMPHQNNGHQLYQQTYLGERLYIAGSETALSHPGYMEGAIYSANQVCHQILQREIEGFV